ncbi:MAG: PAS domain S-box protein [Nitrospiraceae bacterium]|nr:MAG: PAS domain S-box protein [Nitrospiraceae bacterium]
MIFINQGGRIIYVNKKCEEVMGYGKEELCSEGFDFMTLIHHDSQTLVQDNFQRHMQGEELEPYEYRLVTKGGRDLRAVHATRLIEHEGGPAILGVVTDITDHKLARDSVFALAEAVSAATGKDFFSRMVKHIALILEADYAYIAEIIPEKPGHARTLSFITDGAVIDNMEVNMAGTPCFTVQGRTARTYPSGVQRLFPEAGVMAALHVEGYAGVPLFDSAGEQLGLMAVMYRKSIRNVRLVESVLQIFASRASSEIERTRSEMEIARANREYKNILENSLVGIFKTTVQGEILFVNRTAAGMFGFSSSEEMMQASVLSFYRYEKDRTRFLKLLRQSERVANYEMTAVTKSGNNMNILMSAAIDGDVITGVLLDITEARQSQADLRKSEEKYKKLIEIANDAIFLADTKTGIIIDANRRAAQMLGIPLSNIIGMHQSYLHPPREKERCRKIFMDYVRKGEGRTYDLYVVHSSGKEIPVEISVSVTEIGGKQVIQGIFRDMSHHKEVEAELRKHHDRLEELVAERTQELTEANRNLRNEIEGRKKAEKISQGYLKQLQALSSEMALIEENEKRRIATELHDCVGQTLALSRIKLGLLSKSIESPDLKNSIREVLQMIEQTIGETRSLTFELSPPILYELGLVQAIKWLIEQFSRNYSIPVTLIDCNLDKAYDSSTRFFLYQAVRELLFNAAKHAHASAITIVLSKKDGRFIIVVEDNGTGFSPPSASREGFGLFSIREKMRHIQGEFDIKSAPGEGTRVTLSAPLPGEQDTRYV